MEFYLYMFKYSIIEARPSSKWLKRCRWYGIKNDGSIRFKNVLNYLEAVNYPFFKVNFKGDEYVIIVKAGGLREKFSVMCPELLYDVVISPDELKSLEDDKWRHGKYKFNALTYAIYILGLKTKANTKMSEVREMFQPLYENAKGEFK